MKITIDSDHPDMWEFLCDMLAGEFAHDDCAAKWKQATNDVYRQILEQTEGEETC